MPSDEEPNLSSVLLPFRFKEDRELTLTRLVLGDFGDCDTCEDDLSLQDRLALALECFNANREGGK